jgi:hypothetical protein
MSVGDKILVLVSGPHGHGLVPAEVTHVYASGGLTSKIVTNGWLGFRDDQEGIEWTRGHDPTTPEACALLTAAHLS